MRRYAALLFITAISIHAEELKTLTLEDLGRVNFSGNTPQGLTWIDADHYLQRKQSGLAKVNALTGESKPFFDAAKMEAAFGKLPGFDAKTAKAVAGRQQMNRDRTAALVNQKGVLYHYIYGSDAAVKLTPQPLDGIENIDFSPDGRAIAFVRGNNLHVLDIESQKVTALTTDGSAKLLNGKLDWVYQEEVYGRGEFKSYWWSPDSKRIAFLQLNEEPVKQFTVIDHIPNYQTNEITNYPKSGTPNPNVKLGVSDLTGKVQWVDLANYTADEPIIARVGWTPDSSKVVALVCNREQTWMDFNYADPSTGTLTTVFRDTTRGWVEADNLTLPHWLKDGGFLFFSERSGFKHLYHYGPDGKCIRAVTSGNWEARMLHGVDETNGFVYFSGTERSSIGGDVYRIKLDGTGLERLTQAEGTHRATFNSALTYFIDTWSDAYTPTQVKLHKSDGAVARVIAENKVDTIKQYKLSKPEFLQVKTRDGFMMEAMLIKPFDFDPNKKYPVWSHTYSGPHAPSVHNAWQGGRLYDQVLAQKGYLIWVCDNRSASGKGAESAWTSYKQLGVQELKDLEDGVAYLKSLPYVDGARIGINGWSFGGFMTAYAMTHSKVFKVGIAGGSVTDWHLYDTIYTERYMQTPKNNPDGYAKTSVIKAAKDLHGKLLLIHGTMDDNVHMQNTMQFVYELQKAGKQFDLMLYPKSRHGVGDPQLSKHMQELMTKYILDNL